MDKNRALRILNRAAERTDLPLAIASARAELTMGIATSFDGMTGKLTPFADKLKAVLEETLPEGDSTRGSLDDAIRAVARLDS